MLEIFHENHIKDFSIFEINSRPNYVEFERQNQKHTEDIQIKIKA